MNRCLLCNRVLSRDKKGQRFCTLCGNRLVSSLKNSEIKFLEIKIRE